MVHDEVGAGSTPHALRFTTGLTQRAYLWPARHFASGDTGPSVPPMGMRVRLKSGVDISRFSPANQVMQLYGQVDPDSGQAQ